MTYTEFTEIKDTGKTKVWSVDNANDGSHLGTVRWNGGWRKYVFQPIEGWSIWSADCLRDVAGFLEEQMAARRAAARPPIAATCPSCYRTFTIRGDGLMPKHSWPARDCGPCDGSEQPPAVPFSN